MESIFVCLGAFSNSTVVHLDRLVKDLHAAHLDIPVDHQGIHEVRNHVLNGIDPQVRAQTNLLLLDNFETSWT